MISFSSFLPISAAVFTSAWHRNKQRRYHWILFYYLFCLFMVLSCFFFIHLMLKEWKFASFPDIYPATLFFLGRNNSALISPDDAVHKLAQAQFEGLDLAAFISHVTLEWKTKWILNSSNLYLPVKNQ